MRSNLWALTLASALFLPLTISIGVGATEVAPKSAAPAVPEALAVAATSAAPAPASAVPPTAAQVPTAAGEPGGVLSSEPEFGAGSEEDCAPDLAVRAADQTGLFAEAMPPQEAAAHQGVGAEGTAAPEPLPEPLVFLLAEAQRGSVDAQVLLARAFEVGPHKDRAVALHWWEQAAGARSACRAGTRAHFGARSWGRAGFKASAVLAGARGARRQFLGPVAVGFTL